MAKEIDVDEVARKLINDVSSESVLNILEDCQQDFQGQSPEDFLEGMLEVIDYEISSLNRARNIICKALD